MLLGKLFTLGFCFCFFKFRVKTQNTIEQLLHVVLDSKGTKGYIVKSLS